MYFWLCLSSGIGLSLLVRFLARRARRRWRVLALPVGIVALASLAGAVYLFWLGHRGQPGPARETLFEGIEYVRDVRTAPRPMVIHVATIDLTAPGIGFLVTPGEPAGGRAIRARKTSAFVEEFGVQLAINANYFFPFRSESPWDYFPHAGDGVDLCGFAASRGVVYSDRRWREGTLFVPADNRATFEAPAGGAGPYNAVSGNGFLVRRGSPAPLRAVEKEDFGPYPRAALGLSADARRMTFVVVDGKQPGYSEGATLAELSRILIEYGAADAIRLDEGGSCALAAERRPGAARLLNVPINNRIPYRERVVANHLGVFARRAR